MKYINFLLKKIKWLSTTNHKDIGKYLLIKLSKLFDFVTCVLNIINSYIQQFKYWNILIVLTWIILYILNLLKIERILIYIILCVLIYGYKNFFEFILNKENQKKIINYLNNKSDKIYYMLIKLNEITLLTLIIYLEIKIYQLIEWYQKYDYKMYNWIILVISMLVPLKIVLSYMYKFFENIQTRTMLEILWKRAFGVILSVLIFTNLVQILLETYETWLNIIMFTYLYFTLNVWKDLQVLNLNNLTYFKHTANSLKLLIQRNNILTIIIKETWQDKEKVLFYEKYNKKINIINYILLDLTSYKKFKLEMQYKYLNEIKGSKVFKSTKITFLQNFYNAIMVSSIFEDLNQVEYLYLYFNYITGIEKLLIKKKNQIQISEISKHIFFQSQIILYFMWDYLKLNPLLIEDDLFNMINICVNGNCSLELIWEPKLFETKANYEYNKFLNLGNDNLYQEVYDISSFFFIYKNKQMYYSNPWKNILYKIYYEFSNNIWFELENGELIPYDIIQDNTCDIVLNNIYNEKLKYIKNKLIDDYKNKNINIILNEYERRIT